jgi:hypothetical protein
MFGQKGDKLPGRNLAVRLFHLIQELVHKELGKGLGGSQIDKFHIRGLAAGSAGCLHAGQDAIVHQEKIGHRRGAHGTRAKEF